MVQIKTHTAVLGTLVIISIAISITVYHFEGNFGSQGKKSGEINRIISIAPSLTECLYALGCGSRIVGVGDFTTYPDDAMSKPRVGGYINPNYEVMLSLRPDLIIIQGRHEKVTEFCRSNDILFERFEMNNLDNVYTTIMNLGEILNKSNNADSLCRTLKEGLHKISGSVSGLSRPGVFYSLGHTPGNINTLFTAGKHSFISELIAIAGGKNIFDDNEILYPEISKETLVIRAPEIILESVIDKPSDTEYLGKLLADWKKFSTVPAVQNGKIYLIDERYVEIPGPRVVMAAVLLSRLIHPEAFDGK